MLENPFVRVIIVLVGLFFVYIQFKQAKKQMQAQNLKESLITPTQRIENNISEDKKYKLFVYFSLLALILVYFIRNTWLGFIVCSACIAINGKVAMFIIIERWNKKQPYNKVVFLASIILLLISLAFISVYFFDQAQIYYQDEI